MQIKSLVFLLAASLGSLICSAQKSINLRIIDDETAEPVKGVMIPGQSTSSDADGNMELLANVGDTIELQMPDYPLKKVVISDKSELIVRVTKKVSGDEVYVVVDETAHFPGGMKEYYEYIANNLRYPSEARERGIEGKVFVEFIIGSDGVVDPNSVRAIHSADPLLAAEAVRVARNSPPWLPGKKDGRLVRQKMVVPYSFKLAGPKKKR